MLFEPLSSLLEPMLAVDEREKSQQAQKVRDHLILSIQKLRKLAGNYSCIIIPDFRYKSCLSAFRNNFILLYSCVFSLRTLGHAFEVYY